MKNDDIKLFDYYDETSQRGMKTVIGDFISNNSIFINENGGLISIEEVNNIDRVKLAREFIKKRTNDGVYKIDYFYNVIRNYTEDELINDIALFIDNKIPFNYFIKLNGGDKLSREDRRAMKLKYKGIDSIPGMKFWYEENYKDELNKNELVSEESKIIKFTSEENKIEKYLEWGLITENQATKKIIKKFKYKDNNTKKNIETDVVGYIITNKTYETLVLDVCGNIVKSNIDYFKEMQKK